MEIVNGNKVNVVMITKNMEEKTIEVSISVDSYQETGTMVRLTTKDLIPYLKNERDIEVGECLKSSVISNMNENSQFGTWVFKMTEQVILHNVDVPFLKVENNVVIENITSTLTPVEQYPDQITGEPQIITRIKKPKKAE